MRIDIKEQIEKNYFNTYVGELAVEHGNGVPKEYITFEATLDARIILPQALSVFANHAPEQLLILVKLLEKLDGTDLANSMELKNFLDTFIGANQNNPEEEYALPVDLQIFWYDTDGNKYGTELTVDGKTSTILSLEDFKNL